MSEQIIGQSFFQLFQKLFPRHLQIPSFQVDCLRS